MAYFSSTSLKKVFFVFLLFVTAKSVFAQNKVSFAYDEAGNRIKREIVIPKVSKPVIKSQSKNESFYDALGEHTIKITPTPSGIINVCILHFIPTHDIHIEVFSVGGVEVFRQEVSNPENIVDISSQPKGIYILKVLINGEPTDWKITKQ